jgi:deazaflavin-dependent oxidoreductase (nitroreductase family)
MLDIEAEASAMRTLLIIASAAAAALVAAMTWWRRHPRVGSGYMNRVVNPWLVRHGVLDHTRGEIGLVEHVGRRSGVVRISPIHLVPTDDGFRMVVPLGVASQWARNVLAAGHCRIQVGGTVQEFDRPAFVAATDISGVPPIVGQVMNWLGFRYLLLHRLSEHPGSLNQPAIAPAEAVAA